MITTQGLKQLGFSSIDFVLQNNSDGTSTFIAQWNSDQPQPSEAEIETAHAEWQAEHDSTEYQRLRAPEYPPIGDQLDALFHAGVFPADMAATLQAVKDKYPR
jgi:hypothetical protein